MGSIRETSMWEKAPELIPGAGVLAKSVTS